MKKEEITLTRRERKKKNQRYAIIRAAREKFQKYGIDNVAVNDIAEAADISYATFFNYFASKDALHTAIYEEEVEDLFEFANSIDASISSASEKIVAVFQQWWEDTAAYRTICLRVTEKYVRDTESGIARETSLLTLFEQMLAAGVTAGEFDEAISVQQEALGILGLLYAGQIYNSDFQMVLAKLNRELELLRKKG